MNATCVQCGLDLEFNIRGKLLSDPACGAQRGTHLTATAVLGNDTPLFRVVMAIRDAVDVCIADGLAAQYPREIWMGGCRHQWPVTCPSRSS
jgi:hypothetical protein